MIFIKGKKRFVSNMFYCVNCGCTIAEIRKLNNVDFGAYCQFCGKGIKFLNSDERKMILGGKYKLIEKERGGF